MNDFHLHPEPSSPLPSERSFGILFVVLFTLASGYVAYTGLPSALSIAFAAMALAMLAAALLAPGLLRPLNRAWYALGQFLGRIVSPLVLGLMFFVVLTPVAVVIRLFGRDELKLRKRDTASYWLDRGPAEPRPDSFKHQF